MLQCQKMSDFHKQNLGWVLKTVISTNENPRTMDTHLTNIKADDANTMSIWSKHIKTYQDKNEDCTSQKRTKASKIVAMRCYARYSQTGFASTSDPRFPRFAWLLGKPSHEWFSWNSSYPYLDCNAMTQISLSMTLWQSNIVRKDPSFISIYTWTMWFHQLLCLIVGFLSSFKPMGSINLH